MYKTILNKFRIIHNLWLHSYPLSLLDEPSGIVREKWNIKKDKLRMVFAFISTLLIYIGAELSSPNYSFTTHFYEEILSKSDLISSLNTSQFSIKGSTLKVFIFIALSFFIYFNFLFNDPLSDTELLRKIIIPESTDQKKIRFFHKLMINEIHFYAEYCPSNLLPKRCEECRTQGCGNRLSTADRKKSSRWNTIFANLPNNIICNLLISTHRCRLIFYVQYCAFFSVIILILIYVIVRFFEYRMKLEVIYYNSSLLAYIITILSIGLVIKFFNSTNTTGSRGVWGHFRENTETVFEEQNFKEVFDQYVCKHNKKDFSYTEINTLIPTLKAIPHEKISGSEIQALLTSMNCLDKIIKLKLLSVLSNDNYANNDKDHLRNTLTALIEMLITLNQSRHRFRGVLLTKNDDNDYLSPLVIVPFAGQPFLSYRNLEYFRENLSMRSDAIAVQAWQKMCVVSASDGEIPIFHQEQSEYLRSIIALPIIADSDIQKEFRSKRGIMVNSVIGVVCIDCDNEEILSNKNQYLNSLIMQPFVNRLLFQMLFALIDRGA